MAKVYKVLGQKDPVATTPTTLYTVPAATSAVCSSLVVCNRDAAAAHAYRVSVAVVGAVAANEQYLFYDQPINANDTHKHVLGITLAATDVVRVYADAQQLSFNLSGAEIT